MSQTPPAQPQHTPGPWSWSYSDATYARPIALTGDTTDVLLASEDADGPRAYVSPADQALLAAAPDLLDAAEAVLHQLDYLRGLWGDEGVTRRLADRVRAAVAKAKEGA